MSHRLRARRGSRSERAPCRDPRARGAHTRPRIATRPAGAAECEEAAIAAGHQTQARRSGESSRSATALRAHRHGPRQHHLEDSRRRPAASARRSPPGFSDPNRPNAAAATASEAWPGPTARPLSPTRDRDDREGHGRAVIIAFFGLRAGTCVGDRPRLRWTAVQARRRMSRWPAPGPAIALTSSGVTKSSAQPRWRAASSKRQGTAQRRADGRWSARVACASRRRTARRRRLRTHPRGLLTEHLGAATSQRDLVLPRWRRNSRSGAPPPRMPTRRESGSDRPPAAMFPR
jgi:hypothetical protein